MIHSKFSPSSMEAELLERTFVQREPLARRLVDLFVESALTESKHHVLLVGPRGIGKSHLAAVVYHRLNRRDDLKDKLLIAYLREDEWGITSLLDLLVRILRTLGTETSGLSILPAEAVEQRAWDLIGERLAGRTLLVILENLAEVFRNLGEDGQRKWRALIHTYPCWAVLATTPALSADVSSQAAPFYGFFEIQNLGPLSVNEGIALLQQLARTQGNNRIAEYVSSPAGRAKVRAVQHLANGNHRIFVIFYDFLAEGRQDEMLEPLLKTIDSLTPYYQSEMKDLSPQQRKLVEFLCEHRVPATVKTIASRCFVTHQTAASQLRQLLAARYVRVTRIGRESYYELNEPLLRICVETKARSTDPLRLLVEFLRYWFSREELEEQFAATPPELPKRAYIAAALKEYETAEGHVHLAPEVGRLCAALTGAQQSGDPARIRSAAEELAEISKIAEDWDHYVRGLWYQGRAREALPLLLRASERAPDNPDVLKALASAYEDDCQLDKALSAIERAIASNPRIGVRWLCKARVLRRLDRHAEALKACSQAARLSRGWHVPVLQKGEILLKMGRLAEAERLLGGLLKRSKRVPDVGLLLSYGCALAERGKLSEALTHFRRATDEFPKCPEGWRLAARTLLHLKRPSGALAAIGRARQLEPTDHRIVHLHCETFLALGEYEQALEKCPPDIVAHQLMHELERVSAAASGVVEVGGHLSKLAASLQGEGGREALLGGLIQFASLVAAHLPETDPERLKAWRQVITELFSGDPRFGMLLKMFDVMARYRESGDRRVLLELPLEQRRLVEVPEE